MGVRWRGFEIPRSLICDETTYTRNYGKFIAEPFERGYGTTLGNSIRRILLSSIEGAAVTSVKIDGILHEFSTIPGVVEDISEIILNIKQLVVLSHNKGPNIVYIKANKKGDVKAGDIVTNEFVEIINPELHIATLSKKTKLNIELEVNKGRGYLPREKTKKEDLAIGVIPIDAIFSPVRKVNYHAEDTRIGQVTDFDKLILEIWTDGSVEPKEALLYGIHVLRRHLDVFLEIGELPPEEEEAKPKEDRELINKLATPIQELELSVRSANCLKEADIKTIDDLVEKSESELLSYKNFGKKSLDEIIAVLDKMGLSLGIKKILKGDSSNAS